MLAERLRELAIQEYGCTKFISLTEANKEITISYWPTLKHIEKWKQNPEHKKAQALGRASVALGHPWPPRHKAIPGQSRSRPSMTSAT